METPFFPLPSLRKKILSSFFYVVLIYSVLGLLLVYAVFLASGITPKAIHRNYDSLSAANQMRLSLHALKLPFKYTPEQIRELRNNFNKSLEFEEGNITEAGEKELIQQVRLLWNNTFAKDVSPTNGEFVKMELSLAKVVQINEQALFDMAEEGHVLSMAILIGSIVLFALVFLFSIILADRLTTNLTTPIKAIAEKLKSRPLPTEKLKLPSPVTLEMLILSGELTRLWDRVGQLMSFNIEEISAQRARFQTILEAIDHGVLVVDNLNRVLYINSLMARLVGMATEDIQGFNWTDLSTTNDNYLRLKSSIHYGVMIKEVSDLQVPITLEGLEHKFSVTVRELNGSGKEQHEVMGKVFLLHEVKQRH